MKYIALILFISLALAQTNTTETPQCKSGECCGVDGKFKSATTVCRLTSNPCEKPAYCTGVSADCPETPKKFDGASCLADGFCTSGHCIRYECVGECCESGRVAADGTSCFNSAGTCEKGTCVFVIKKKEPVYTKEQKALRDKAEKKIRGKLEDAIEGLLKRQEKIVVRRERRKLMEQAARESFLQKVSDIPVISTFSTIASSTAKNIENSSAAQSLQASSSSSTPFYKTNAFYCIIACACVACALVVLFVVIGSNNNSNDGKQKKQKKQQKKPHADESESDSLYEPPAF